MGPKLDLMCGLERAARSIVSHNGAPSVLSDIKTNVSLVIFEGQLWLKVKNKGNNASTTAFFINNFPDCGWIGPKGGRPKGFMTRGENLKEKQKKSRRDPDRTCKGALHRMLKKKAKRFIQSLGYNIIII